MAVPTSGSHPHHRTWPESSLLARLKPATRSALLQIGTAVTYPAQHTLMCQADQTQFAVLLLSGSVKVLADNALLGISVGGELVGEMAVLNGRPRSATVMTCTATRARVISGGELARFLSTWPDAAIGVVTMMSNRLRWANRRRVDFATRPARTRICRVLAEFAEIYGRPDDGGTWHLGVALTQAEIGTAAGVSLTSVEKTLQELQRDGVVRWAYRSTSVTDMGRLRGIAEITEEIPY